MWRLMGFSGPPAISNSILPSCIPSLRSSRDFIVAEGYSILYSYRRVTGFKEPGCLLSLEAVLPSENAPSYRGKRGGGKTQHAMSTIKKITTEFHCTDVIKCTIRYPASYSPLHVPNPNPLIMVNTSPVTSSTKQSESDIVWTAVCCRLHQSVSSFYSSSVIST